MAGSHLPAGGLIRIEVGVRPGVRDAVGEAVLADCHELGIEGVRAVAATRVYTLAGLPPDAAEPLASNLFCDPVVECYAIGAPLEPLPADRTVEIAYHPGVTDPVVASIQKGVGDLGFPRPSGVWTSRRYAFEGNLSESELGTIVEKLLANRVIERIVRNGPAMAAPPEAPFELRYVHLSGADDAALTRISHEGHLALSLEEMRAIGAHFRALGREPTDAELETLAQTWSEHCVHKTMKDLIDFDGERIDGLLASTIMRTTEHLARPWCISVFEDNSGVVAFDDRYHLSFKVETHNFPSALEPYGGAATGIGGVIRDALGTGRGADPILNTDVFCVAPLDTPPEAVPPGSHHPRRILRGVVAGVRDYGNRMGIPTVNGAVCFDPLYVANPLVYCGTVGLLPADRVEKRLGPGHVIVLVGGRTGRDGIHGATFSSEALTAESEAIAGSAVQIGNAIEEKRVADALLRARELDLYDTITDCGGGGLSSAIGEMAEGLGAVVHLDRVPLKYPGLSHAEIWISEAQERMVLATSPERANRLAQVFEAEGVETAVLGEFTDTGRLELRYHGTAVCDLDLAFLHGGRPREIKRATRRLGSEPVPQMPEPDDLSDDLMRVLALPTVASKERIIRQYDHEVQGRSVLKPLVGVREDGPGDAAIVRPRLDSSRAIAVGCGINARYGQLDAYRMAQAVTDEAMRQIVAVGGDPDRTALLDNFSWGDVDEPETLGDLVLAARGCAELALAYGTPFVSGKDSLRNFHEAAGHRVSIPPTLLISALSVLPDAERAVSMDFKGPGHFVYVVGLTQAELGGSQYWALHGALGDAPPAVDPELGKSVLAGVARAIQEGLVLACHDPSDGGLGIALAEMAFSGEVGAEVSLEPLPRSEDLRRDDWALFSESASRFIVEVDPVHRAAFEEALGDVPASIIGTTTDALRLQIRGLRGRGILQAELAELKAAWQGTLADF